MPKEALTLCMRTTSRSSQRGVFHLILFIIPLSLLFFAYDIRLWGLLAGVALLVGVSAIAWAVLRLERFAADAQKVRLFGTPIDRVSLTEAVKRIEGFIAHRRSALVCTPDTMAVLRAQRDRRLREVYERAGLVTPDGTGLVWAARLLGAPLKERVSGIDLLEKLFARQKIFLLGAAPGVAEQAAARLAEKYSNLQIVGAHHGYFRPDENERVLGSIRAAQPDLALVGLGVPQQELWMLENSKKLDGVVLIGVGGCFDVWAGRLLRAPQRWQKLGLEWAYRLLQEPRRIVRVSAIPFFIAQVYLLKLVRALAD